MFDSDSSCGGSVGKSQQCNGFWSKCFLFPFSSGFCLVDALCFPSSWYEWAEVVSFVRQNNQNDTSYWAERFPQPASARRTQRMCVERSRVSRVVYTAVKVINALLHCQAMRLHLNRSRTVHYKKLKIVYLQSLPDRLEMETLKDVHVISLEYQFDFSPLILDKFSPMTKVTTFIKITCTTSSLTVHNVFNFSKIQNIIRTFVELQQNILQICTVL